jgi:quinol monooxygenase YgiN
MVEVGLLVSMKAKPGKEADLERFLGSALPLVDEEPATTAWFAIRLSDSEFAIVDFFPGDPGRQEHLSGRAAEALMGQAPELLAEPPQMEFADVVASKLPG